MRDPTCYWCHKEVDPDDLVMGDVRLRRKGHSTRRDSWDPYDEEQYDWEEDVEEKCPFHQDCLAAYKAQVHEGCFASVALFLLVAGLGGYAVARAVILFGV